MPESIHHQRLKQEATQLLVQRGYTQDKILIEKKRVKINYYGHDYSFRIDVYASNGEQIAVECGNFPKWKRPIYESHFGKNCVIHLPYPPHFGRYTATELEEDKLTDAQAKQFLADSYVQYIYTHFKGDPVYDFQEFNQENREVFDIDNHRPYREINPDHGTRPEAVGKTIWMNFPDTKTLSKDQYKHHIHWGMLHYGARTLAVTIIFGGREPCERFLEQSEATHRRIHELLTKLPAAFHIRDGFLFWDKKASPPYDKEWNDPIPCCQLSWEDYERILENLENLIRLAKNGEKVGPVLDLAKVFCLADELPDYIDELRELYALLLKPETKVDVISRNIKQMESWQWYVSEHKEWTDLYENYLKQFGKCLSREEFNKACRRIWTCDKEFQEYRKG